MAKKTDTIAGYVNILRQADIFYDLTSPQLEMIAALCSKVMLKEDEVVFEENSAGDDGQESDQLQECFHEFLLGNTEAITFSNCLLRTVCCICAKSFVRFFRPLAASRTSVRPQCTWPRQWY